MVRVNDNGVWRNETPEETAYRENWERKHPTPPPVTPIEDRVADIELMLADIIGGAL